MINDGRANERICLLQGETLDRTPRSDGRDGLRVVRVLEEVDRRLHRTEIHHGRLPAERCVVVPPLDTTLSTLAPD